MVGSWVGRLCGLWVGVVVWLCGDLWIGWLVRCCGLGVVDLPEFEGVHQSSGSCGGVVALGGHWSCILGCGSLMGWLLG